MGPTQFGCPYCPLIAKSSRNINRHMFTHTGVKPFLCQFCDYSSHRKDQLKSHMTNKHKDIFELWLFWFNWKFECNSTEIEFFIPVKSLISESSFSNWFQTIWLLILSKDDDYFPPSEKASHDSYWRKTI